MNPLHELLRSNGWTRYTGATNGPIYWRIEDGRLFVLEADAEALQTAKITATTLGGHFIHEVCCGVSIPAALIAFEEFVR